MGNYTKSFNFRNGVQVDDSNFIVNANGLVGIGTSIPQKRLDVRGNAKIIGDTTLVGLTSITDLNVVDVVTIGSTIKIDSGSGIITATKFVGDASGLTNIVAIATDGFIANTGTLSTTAKIGIGSEVPSTQLDVLGDSKFVGVTTFSGITTSPNTIFANKFSSKTLEVEQASTFSGNINADGDIVGDNATNITNINNISASTLTGTVQTAAQPNVTSLGTLSSLNITGNVTVGGTVGFGTTAYFSDNAKAVFGDAENLSIYYDGEDSYLRETGTGNLFIESSFVRIRNSDGNKTVATFSHGTGLVGGVQLYYNDEKSVETISAGASVYNQLNVASLGGGASGLSSHFGSLRYGNQDSSQTYSTRRSLDLINTDSGNINFYLNANNLEAPNDGSDFHWHKGFNNDQLMTLTGIGGSLGIGVTNPTVSLEVDGKIKVTGLSTFTNKLFVGNNLSVKENLDVRGTITGNLTGTVNGNVNVTSGISTFNNVSTGVATVTTLKASKIGIKTSLVGSNDLFKINVIPDNEIIVDDAGRIGIRTTSSGIADNVVINASQASAVFGVVGVGTTIPLSAADFSKAGADATGSFANKMFMLPPKVDNTQRVGLLTETGAMIYNTSLNKLQVYTGGSWETITSAE